MSCTVSSEAFGRYFKENMDALGLPTPTGYYDSIVTTMGAIATLAETASLYPQMSIMQAWKLANPALKLRSLVAVTAAYYVGAAIGSAAVAIGRSLGCGASLADAIQLAKSNGIYGNWVEKELAAHPEFLKPR